MQSLKGTRTRPTSDLLRQALFNVLGARIHGARMLDLFAGTGAVGLDALSRGAARVTFVELDRKALASLRANLAALNLLSQARVLQGDVLPALIRLQAARDTFDCIFADPPYTGDLAGRCIEILADGALLSDNGALVVQGSHKTVLPDRVGVLGRTWGRRYGESRLTLYSRETACR